MGLIAFLEKKTNENFTFWDIGLLKTYGAIPGLILGAFFPEFIKQYLWLFIAVFVVLMFRYLYLLFIKKA
jgi:hypothetical protein